MDIETITVIATVSCAIYAALTFHKKKEAENQPTPEPSVPEPDITLSQRIIKGTKRGEYTVEVTVQNATSLPIKLTELTMSGEYEDRSGGETNFVCNLGTQNFLGRNCTLDSKQLVISGTGHVSPKLSFTADPRLVQRLVFRVQAKAGVSDGPDKVFYSPEFKEYIV